MTENIITVNKRGVIQFRDSHVIELQESRLQHGNYSVDVCWS